MAGPLSSANQEIREAADREQARRLAMLKRPRLLTDRLLTQLEELNLDDVKVVPARFGPSIDELLESVRSWPEVESRFGSRMRPGVPTSALIDVVFAVQEVLSPRQSERDSGDDATDIVLLDLDQIRR